MQLLIRLSADISLDSPIAASCGTGVTACILALGLYRLGKTNVAIYDGSWTEWATAPNLPIVGSSS
jgi:thiosulfate/3-mercaptopyruvate sulfurtransferase